MYETAKIIHHYTRLFETIASEADYSIEKKPWGTLISSGIDEASFNCFEITDLRVGLMEALLQVNIPFVCLPGEQINAAQFVSLMDDSDLMLVDTLVAQYINLPQQSNYSCKLPGLTIELVNDNNGLTHFDKLTSLCFHHIPGNLQKFFSFVSKHDFKTGNLHFFIAKFNATPVGAALLATHDNLAGNYWDCVHPEYRKSGIGSELVKARLDYASRLGHRHVIVQCQSSSLSLYQRLGFISTGSIPLYASL